MDQILWPRYIWEGGSSPPRAGLALVLRQGKIAALITPEEAVARQAAQPSLPLRRFPQLTLLPGLIDCHVHLALDGRDFQISLQRWDRPGTMEALIREQLQPYYERGILAIRDGGDRRGLILPLRRTVRGRVPRLLATGQAIFKAGRYGSFLGTGVKNREEALQVVRNLSAAGADQIKILVSGIVSFREWGKVGPPQFTAEELVDMVELAHSLRLRVMAHASGAEGVTLALQAGVDSLEHGYFLGAAGVELLAKKGITWVPTLAPVALQIRHPVLKAKLSPEEERIIAATLEEQMQRIAQARELGVAIAVGTDAGAAGVLHAVSYGEELRLLAAAGLSPGEVLQAATVHGAKVLGLEGERGSIAPGKDGALIGVEGDPWQDISALDRVRLIIAPT